MHESSECSIQAGMCGLKTHVIKIKVKHLSVAVFTTVGNYLCAFHSQLQSLVCLEQQRALYLSFFFTFPLKNESQILSVTRVKFTSLERRCGTSSLYHQTGVAIEKNLLSNQKKNCKQPCSSESVDSDVTENVHTSNKKKKPKRIPHLSASQQLLSAPCLANFNKQYEGHKGGRRSVKCIKDNLLLTMKLVLHWL